MDAGSSELHAPLCCPCDGGDAGEGSGGSTLPTAAGGSIGTLQAWGGTGLALARLSHGAAWVSHDNHASQPCYYTPGSEPHLGTAQSEYSVKPVKHQTDLWVPDSFPSFED